MAFLLAFLLPAPSAANEGHAGCRCADASTYDFSAVKGLPPCGPDELKTAHLLKPDLEPLCIKAPKYGIDGCAKYDKTEATCTGDNPPTWCDQAWCYVFLTPS